MIFFRVNNIKKYKFEPINTDYWKKEILIFSGKSFI